MNRMLGAAMIVLGAWLLTAGCESGYDQNGSSGWYNAERSNVPSRPTNESGGLNQGSRPLPDTNPNDAGRNAPSSVYPGTMTPAPGTSTGPNQGNAPGTGIGNAPATGTTPGTSATPETGTGMPPGGATTPGGGGS